MLVNKESNEKYFFPANIETLELLQPIMQKEYELEYDRTKTLITKNTALLALSGVGLTVLTRINLNDINKLGNYKYVLLTSLLGQLFMAF